MSCAAIFENLLEFRPELCVDAGKQGLLQWLLRRIKAKVPFDGNKLYVSELLSILVQQTPENRLLLGDLDGIDALLQQLAVRILFVNFTRSITNISPYIFTVLQKTRSSHSGRARNDGEFIQRFMLKPYGDCK